MSSKFNIYTIYDKKAEEAGPPFVAVNDSVAVRNVCLTLSDQLYPEDYELVQIGEYDSKAMSVCSCGVYREIPFLTAFHDFKEKINAYNRMKQMSLLNTTIGGKKHE